MCDTESAAAGDAAAAVVKATVARGQTFEMQYTKVIQLICIHIL